MTAHRDVGGDSGPRALCTGEERGILCTESWLRVTCAACHAARHPDAPLSKDELHRGIRATGVGTSRPLTAEEIKKGWNRP